MTKRPKVLRDFTRAELEDANLRPKQAPPSGPPEGLRDQIAIRAMEIIVGGNASTFLEQVRIAPNESFQNVARISFGLADAMIEARSR